MSKHTFIGPEDLEYFGELLRKIPRPAIRRLPSPNIHDVDNPLTRRLQSLLEVIAEISVYEKRNVAATMASLTDIDGTLQTTLYIAIDQYDNEAARDCCHHPKFIFDTLRQVPLKPPALDGSPKVNPNEFQNKVIEIGVALHNHSFGIFSHRVTKHRHKCMEIRRHVEQDQTYFEPEHRWPSLITWTWSSRSFNAEVTNTLATTNVNRLFNIYSYWTTYNLLPKDPLDEDKLTLLDNADAWLAESA